MTTLSEKIGFTSTLKKILIIITIVLVIATVSVYGNYVYQQEQEKKKLQIEDDSKCPTIRNFEQYVEYMYSGNWSSYCLPKSYAIRESTPVSINQTIQHIITAKVVQFEDSPQRIITTLSNEKYIVDNYTKSMKIGDTIHIFEVKNIVTKCLPSVVMLYNGSAISGVNYVSEFINNTHWLDFTSSDPHLFFSPYNDDACKPFITYFEVNAN